MKWFLNHAIHGKKPWDVQAEAMKRSEGHVKYAYFLEQGLGKTPLTINDFLNYADDEELDGMVVFAPNTFKLDWPLAVDEWGVGDKFSFAGSWPRSPVPLKEDRFIYSINYEAMRAGRGRDALDELLTKRRVMLVIDESSSIKNPMSQTAKVAISFAKASTMVRELNGTPMVQNVMDYYAQLRVLGELNGVNPFQFRNRFAVMGGYMGKQVKGMQNEEELYQILGRCSFRALKKDWRDLPPKVYVPVHLEMTKKQESHYRSMMEDFFTQVNGMDVTADMVLTQMDKLRQISSCIAIQDGVAQRIEEPKNNPKIEATLDIINGGDTKVIVVYFYRESGEILNTALSEFSPAWMRGGMSPEEIKREKDRFNTDPSCRVAIMQEEAHSRGHTMLGGSGRDRCNRMVFYENSFSLLHRAQIEDRNHRGEQDMECSYFDLVTSPMDAAVVKALVTKKAAADMVDEIVKTIRQRRY